jgi:ABC-type multidrug transport system fused ATPase/permease subunit
VKDAKVAASIIFDIIDDKSSCDTREKKELKKVEKGEIEFKNINFKYPSRD